ncbi:DUF5779 family protein [Halomarina ordinaria]|uniref:DUF5779 family protein n=1 Tax=Halomarina ordinaria TaxID=3033939 RepID=A0ABD5UC64_9EURY|nr:DUF5779 family protein [Halomarina sp. PSRA2]
MADFDLDLQAVEREIDEAAEAGDRVVLGVLDGTTAPDEWTRLVREGVVLVLAVEGDVNELASGFAREVRDVGGHLVHFRSFLVVTPEGVHIDTDRLA